MGFAEELHKLAKTSDEGVAQQLACILDQLASPDEDLYASDEEENPNDETEDDISYYADDDPGHDFEHDGLTGEHLLLGQFLASTADALLQSRAVSQQLASQNKESQEPSQSSVSRILPLLQNGAEESKERRPATPVMGPADPDSQRRLDDARIPSAMKARPKIPRTPIPLDRLEQIKRQNEELLRNAVHIQKNEGANKKKQIQLARQLPVPSEQSRPGPEEDIPINPLSLEAPKSRGSRAKGEDRKAKELRKDPVFAPPKRQDGDPPVTPSFIAEGRGRQRAQGR